MMLLPTVAFSLLLSASAEEVSPDVSSFVTSSKLGLESDLANHGRAKGKFLPSESSATPRKAQLLVSLKRLTRGRTLAIDSVAIDALTSTDEPRADEAPAKRPGLCSADMIMIGAGFCIDIYEDALLEVLPEGGTQPWSPYLVLPAGKVFRAVSAAGQVPQGYISGHQAKAACENAGKRLCKRDEWKLACMGPNRTIYPYGNSRETGRCNNHGRSSMQFYFHLDDKPENAWKWGFNGNMIDPRLNQLEGTLAKTGEHPNCTNEYGVYDMMGNLHEWVDDPDGTFQGGYYLDTHLNGDGCYYATTAHPMSHFDYSTGFRCCADAEPIK